jgi:hypothetical protein
MGVDEVDEGHSQLGNLPLSKKLKSLILERMNINLINLHQPPSTSSTFINNSSITLG